VLENLLGIKKQVFRQTDRVRERERKREREREREIENERVGGWGALLNELAVLNMNISVRRNAYQFLSADAG